MRPRDTRSGEFLRDGTAKGIPGQVGPLDCEAANEPEYRGCVARDVVGDVCWESW
jgi:hypothetical protein